MGQVAASHLFNNAKQDQTWLVLGWNTTMKSQGCTLDWKNGGGECVLYYWKTPSQNYVGISMQL